jgi:N-acetyl-anhydromuramyl-L-alanine amidase AmpD
MAETTEFDRNQKPDERDASEISAEPNPQPGKSEFIINDDIAFETASTDQQIAVVCRPLPNEVVPSCNVKLGSVSATANGSGKCELDLSGLADGSYPLRVVAPDTDETEMGPEFQPDPSKERVWRSLNGTVEVRGGRIVKAEPSEFLVVGGKTMRVLLQPAWLRAPIAGARTGPIDAIVIHHTAGHLGGDLNEFLYGNRVSIHYLVAPNGDVFKLVMEDRKAAQAGYSYWQGGENLNGTSIGIEMSHISGDYPKAQVDATIALVEKLHQAFPAIPPGRVIGHSDIGICEPTAPKPCKPASPKRLGRKSTDPGSTFPWEQIEALGLSLQAAAGSMLPTAFGGYFQVKPDGRLAVGDNDAAQRYGGVNLPKVTGAIKELQENLRRIGYYVGTVDGDFGLVTAMALKMFNQHIFSGTRQAPESKEERLNITSAQMLKRVLNEVDPGALV